MQRSQRVAAVVFLAIAAVVIYQSLYRLGVTVKGQPGAGFMPFLLGLLLAALALALVATGQVTGERGEPFWAPGTWIRPSLAVAVFLAFAAGLPRSGFVVTVGLFVLVWLVVLERKPAWLALVLGSAAAGIVYAVFVRALQVPLPRGTWFGG